MNNRQLWQWKKMFNVHGVVKAVVQGPRMRLEHSKRVELIVALWNGTGVLLGDSVVPLIKEGEHWSRERVMCQDKASPGKHTKITASYARISKSQWLILILSPRNTDVHSVQGSSQRYCWWSTASAVICDQGSLFLFTAGTIHENSEHTTAVCQHRTVGFTHIR